MLAYLADAMIRDRLLILTRATRANDVISTDVFDTLLLRTARSQYSRILEGERLFSNLLAARGLRIEADVLAGARIHSQHIAFRQLAMRGAGEVTLFEIVERQLAVLGLPGTLIADRLAIELEVEKRSLTANRPLGAALRARRAAGQSVIAASDTTLSSQALNELIQHFHGPDLIDRIYSSADHGLTKRDGHLFFTMAGKENVPVSRMTHIGDDLHADVRVPAAMGISVLHLPRHSYRRYLRLADAGLTEARRLLRRRVRISRAKADCRDDAFAFGRDILGPIVTQFCILIWLYVKQAQAHDKTAMLFCARGGIGIQAAFESTVTALGLPPLAMRRENFMISRLVATRAALLARNEAALEELDREFQGNSFADVANALGGRKYLLADEWNEHFAASELYALLFGGSGTDVLADIQQQNALFTRHFMQAKGDADRIILCDTGLYGSTQRLLGGAFPELRIETIQFARANYKGHGEEHFRRVAGLIVEQDFYSPFNVSSCVLRYWQLIESLFEPAIPSVRIFTEDKAGQVCANCGDIRFGATDPSAGNNLLRGALRYIELLPKNGGAIALRDSEIAWHRLKRAITRPTNADLRSLDVGERSVDFGRAEVRHAIIARAQRRMSRLRSLKSQLWREGAIASDFPVLKHVLLPMLGSAFSLRGVFARQRLRPAKNVVRSV
jgi:FMN phosphatase YigB (HAD superfamily)